MYQAIVFVRRSGAHGIGHIGWAFTLREGIFNTGSVENHGGTLFSSSSGMGFWKGYVPDPIVPMRKRHYDEFKVIDVEHADPAQAEGVVRWVSQQAYEAIGRNCMDDTYDILRTYGVANLPPPAYHWIPNYWFDMLTGTHFHIKDKGILWQAKAGQPLTNELLLQDSAGLRLAVVDTPAPPIRPVWRDATTHESAHLQALIHAAPAMPVTRKRSPWFSPFALLAKFWRWQ